MSFGIRTIQRDFTKHRKKAALLGVLFAVMVALSVKAYFDLHPSQAFAAESNMGTPLTPAGSITALPEVASDADVHERIRQSEELWRQLRETRGAPSAVAFTFDPSYFTLDPSHQPAAPSVTPTPAANPSTVVVDSHKAQQAHMDDLEKQIRQLTVRSTIMGTGGNKPKAIVNQQLLTIGDTILGFEITAIRAREVEFSKDGITIAVKMPDDLRGS